MTTLVSDCESAGESKQGIQGIVIVEWSAGWPRGSRGHGVSRFPTLAGSSDSGRRRSKAGNADFLVGELASFYLEATSSQKGCAKQRPEAETPLRWWKGDLSLVDLANGSVAAREIARVANHPASACPKGAVTAGMMTTHHGWWPRKGARIWSSLQSQRIEEWICRRSSFGRPCFAKSNTIVPYIK